jgi:hypothetical protein
MVETHILRRWGEHVIDKINNVPDIDAWVRSLTADYGPEAIRHHVGLFRRIVGKARGQYQLPPIDWDLITLPTVDNEHAVGTSVRDGRGRDRESDEERLAATAS